MNILIWELKKRTRTVFFTIIRTILGKDIIYRSKIASKMNDLRLKLSKEEERKEEPWFAEESIPYIEGILKRKYKGFEWGSGGSTIWFAKRTKMITSIEGDKEWCKKGRKRIREEKLKKKTKILLKEVKSKYDFKTEEIENYVSPIKRIKNKSLDYLIIDGSFRLECLKEGLPKLKKGGYLIFDNADLPEYQKELKAIKTQERKVFNNGKQETLILKIA